MDGNHGTESVGNNRDKSGKVGDAHSNKGSSESDRTKEEDKGSAKTKYMSCSGHKGEVTSNREFSTKGVTAAEGNRFVASDNCKNSGKDGNVATTGSYASEIAEHYNRITTKSYAERKKSSIISIRNMNNFIKSVLFNLYIAKNDRVLDLGCGKGGDLLKYKKIGISYYYGLDIADKSIDECTLRYNRHRCPFKADFDVCDVYHSTLNLGRQFDVISIQFSFHYSFESEDSFAATKHNINEHLLENGYLLLTVPDRDVILRRYHRSKAENDVTEKNNSEQQTKSNISFGNEYYTIEFPTTPSDKVFGNQYYFHLQEAVNECVEFLIDIRYLVQEMKKINLLVVENTNFMSFYNANSGKFAGLRRKMLPMRLNTDEVKVMELYRVIVFQKMNGR